MSWGFQLHRGKRRASEKVQRNAVFDEDKLVFDMNWRSKLTLKHQQKPLKSRKQKGQSLSRLAFSKKDVAATYSPIRLPLQYHQRREA